MASTFAITRNHLIFGLCLPLAVLLGYLLAEPFESTSLTVFLIIAAVLIVPVLMRWYHPLLILSWNMVAQVALVPGSPQLWAVMSFVGLFFAILNRSINPEFRFALVPAVTLPLLTLLLVVIITAMVTGGIGFRVLGSQTMGGRNYFNLMAAAAGYFALSSRAIQKQRISLCVALFFLPGMTAIVGRLAQAVGPAGNFLLPFFPPDVDPNSLDFVLSFDVGLTRINGMVALGIAIFSWVLARYGVAGVFNFARPWRLGLWFAAVILAAFGGFRSALLLMATIFLILFWLEKLWRTRILLILLIGTTMGAALVAGFADRLPLPVQRSLSFLPVEIDPHIRDDAEGSAQWRVDMWRATLPSVPQYLFKGKGYNVSGDELFKSQESMFRGIEAQWASAAIAGDYHNGPLSVLIPFGIWGLAAFVWLLAAGARFLYINLRDSPPELWRLNAFLLSLFLARILFFVFVFGSLRDDLFQFLGILGMSVALNVSGQPSNQRSEETMHPAET